MEQSANDGRTDVRVLEREQDDLINLEVGKPFPITVTRHHRNPTKSMSEFTLPPGANMRVCVGGGAGFIGSHIAKRLLQAGYYVVSYLGMPDYF